MTQVSRIRLRPEVEERIYELLDGTLAKLKTKTEIFNFLNDFMSPTEKTVFAKRLAIVVLLEKGRDYASISEILRVTPNTINKMSFRMKYGNGAVRKAAEYIVSSDYGNALVEEILGIFAHKQRKLTGEVYKKPILEKERKLQRLKKEL